MLSDNVFNSLWLCPLLCQLHQRFFQVTFHHISHCWFYKREKLMGGEMDIERELLGDIEGWQRQREVDGFFEIINARQALLCACLMDGGKPIRTVRETGSDGQWHREKIERQITTAMAEREKGGKWKRARCCHSSVMDEEAQQCELSSFKSNLICSSTSRDTREYRAGRDQTHSGDLMKELGKSGREESVKCIHCG